MSVFKIGLSHMFKWSAIGFLLFFILSFIIDGEDGNKLSTNHFIWALIPIAIIFFIISRLILPTIDIDSDGNAIPKRK